MMKHSFSVGGVDMRERFGLIMERFDDVLTPALRPRELVVPLLDGALDYGAEAYDKREITVTCASVRLLSRGDCRALSLAVSRKSRIIRWDEPDKYYIGRVYDPTVIERIAGAAKRFSMVFSCDPFAYGRPVTEAFRGSANLSYSGTARTPTYITITNDTGITLNGLTIIMREAANG